MKTKFLGLSLLLSVSCVLAQARTLSNDEVLNKLDEIIQSIENALNKIDIGFCERTSENLGSTLKDVDVTLKETDKMLKDVDKTLNEVDNTLSFFDSDEFLKTESVYASESLASFVGNIEIEPTLMKFNGDRMYILKFNKQWITTHNKDKKLLTDKETGQVYKPLGVYLKDKEVYVKTKEITGGQIASNPKNQNIAEETNSEVKKINVYPNPVNNYLNIEGVELGSDYQLFDINGKQIRNKKLDSKMIYVGDLKNGVYFIRYKGTAIKFISK